MKNSSEAGLTMSIGLGVLVVLAGCYALVLGYIGKQGQEVELSHLHPLGIRSAIVRDSEKNWRIAHFSVHAVYYAQAGINVIAVLGMLGILFYGYTTVFGVSLAVGLWLVLNLVFTALRYHLAAKSIAEYI
ncbi:hypothetical protein [Gleimia coleocanis]|nr:hypothetical protein [Gleimia coleocanis]